MHIENELFKQGWNKTQPGEFTKRIEGFAPAGTISNGARVVTLTICERGRYLSRVDGWGHVERDIDLREWQDDPAGAIAAVLK